MIKRTLLILAALVGLLLGVILSPAPVEAIEKGALLKRSSPGPGTEEPRAKSQKEKADESFTDKWAVVIGVDQFQDKTWKLEFAVKDAVDFKNYLIDHANFAPDHVKTLTGTDATRANILDAISWLKKAATQGDLAVVYFRTRGTFKPDEWGNDNCLAASDTNANNLPSTAFKASKFPLTVGDENLKAGALVVILDSDFCGIASIPILYMPEDVATKVDPLIVITSAAKNEIAWESKKFENSVFTHYLIEALIKNGNDGLLTESLMSIGNKINDEAASFRKYRTQEPGAFGMSRGKDVLDVKLAAPVTAPHMPPGDL